MIHSPESPPLADTPACPPWCVADKRDPIHKRSHIGKPRQWNGKPDGDLDTVTDGREASS